MRRGCLVLALGLWSASVFAANFNVTSAADTGPGSLRQAILDANANPGADTITFAIASGQQTITLASMLPAVTDSLVIDGTTQPGFTGTPIIEINGAGSNCFALLAPSSTIRGLVVNRCYIAIQLLGASEAVEGSYIGTDVSGAAALPNNPAGIQIEGANDRVGGTTAATRNVISGNAGYGVAIAGATGVVVEGNFIGTDATGTLALPNQFGVYFSGTTSSNAITANVISGNASEGIVLDGTGVTANAINGNLIGTDVSGTAAVGNAADGIDVIRGAAGTVIGGTAASDRNVISGNAQQGIFVHSDAGAGTVIRGNFVGTNVSGNAALPNGNGVVAFATTGIGPGNVISGNTLDGVSVQASNCTIAGNLIGTNASGTSALGNGSTGVRLLGANNTIGGTTAAARNVISGCAGVGLLINNSPSAGNVVLGNYIGTDISGSTAVANQGGGIVLSGSMNTIIGGTAAGAGNVISGNAGFGVTVAGATFSMQGNCIGTNAAGNAAVPNSGPGIDLESTTNVTVGGGVPGAGNLISGNTNAGINVGQITTAPGGITIAGNLIGTDAAGIVAIPNSDGITMRSATNCTIGGTSPAARNVISGNLNTGVTLTFSNHNAIEGNYVGTTSSGTGPLGNGGTGLFMSFSANNTVGGTAAGAANVIRFNHDGVGIGGSSSTSDSVRLNSISSHPGLGMYLGGPVVIPNDPGDGDTGPNGLQNFPVITGAVLQAGTTIVSGTLNSTPSQTFTIDVYDNTVCNASGNGEGLTWVGSTTATTDASGNATWTLTVPLTMNIVTTTATDSAGDTSSFSQCRTASAITNTITISDVTVPEGNTGSTNVAVFTVTVTPAPTLTTTVQYATADNTANAGSDYIATSGTLTFTPGQASKTITVHIVGDTISEPTETFFVNLSNPTNAAIADGQGVGTIFDDDPTGFSVNDTTAYAGHPAVFTITLSNPSEVPLTIFYETQNGTAVAPTDYTTMSGLLTFAPGQLTETLSVSTVNTGAFAGSKTFTLSLSGGPVNRGVGTATILQPAAIPAFSPWLLVFLAAVLGGHGVLLLCR